MVAAPVMKRSVSRAGMPKSPMICGARAALAATARAPVGSSSPKQAATSRPRPGSQHCQAAALVRADVAMSSRGPQARALSSTPPKTGEMMPPNTKDLHLAPLGLHGHRRKAGLHHRAAGRGQCDPGGRRALVCQPAPIPGGGGSRRMNWIQPRPLTQARSRDPTGRPVGLVCRDRGPTTRRRQRGLGAGPRGGIRQVESTWAVPHGDTGPVVASSPSMSMKMTRAVPAVSLSRRWRGTRW